VHKAERMERGGRRRYPARKEESNAETYCGAVARVYCGDKGVVRVAAPIKVR